MSSVAPQSRVRVQRIAEAAVERARLTVVPRPRRVRAPRVPFVTLVSLLLLGGVVGLLMFNTSMQQTSFTVSALEARAADLQSRQQALEMELDELRDPQRLGMWARRHGMVQPQSPAFLLMDGRVLGEAAPATPDDGTGFDPTTPRAALPPALVQQTQTPEADEQTTERLQEQTGQRDEEQRDRQQDGQGGRDNQGGDAEEPNRTQDRDRGEPDRNNGR